MCTTDRQEIVQTFLESGASANIYKCISPLLLDRGTDIKAMNRQCDTTLSHCLRLVCSHSVEFLISYKSDTSFIHIQNSDGFIALLLAAVYTTENI